MFSAIVDNLTRLSFLIDAEDGAEEVPALPSPSSSPPSVVPGQRVGPYVVEAPLARGGMATVWSIRHARLGSRHALKVPLTRDTGLARRALREGRIQANLRHPNIVPVTDLVDVAGVPALVLELVEGGEGLDARIARGRLSQAEVRTIFVQLLDAMTFAHDAGIVHRDLKPGNVLLAEVSGALVARITDFGLARTLGADPARLTQVGQAMGTPLYMAPEQARDCASADVRADVFALGAILYELVTGVAAFDAEGSDQMMARAARGAYNPPELLAPTLPHAWGRAIRAALAPDPDARVQDVAGLRALFEDQACPTRASAEPKALDLEVLPSPSLALCPAASPPPARRTHRLPVRAFVVAGLLVGGVVAGLCWVV